MMAWMMWVSAAHAFCGTYAGSPGDELINETSRVVLAVDPALEQTTLTLDMDVAGATRDFGMVIPVSSGLDPSSVRTVDRALIDSLMEWSSPRAAEYSCDDIEVRQHGAGCSTGCVLENFAPVTYESTVKASEGLVPLAEGETQASTVVVEASFALAEYDIQILSSESGEDLDIWLEAEGFVMPDGADALFDDYLRDDAWFVAVRVRVDAPIEDGAWLTPLQFRSDGIDQWSVPIRVGTLSSKGQQEVLVALLTTSGIPGLSTFPEATIDRDCLMPTGEELGDFYAQAVEEAFDAVGGSGWILEHSWLLNNKCDPCVPQPESGALNTNRLSELGLEVGSFAMWGARASRIRVRYNTADVRTDLAFYDSGQVDSVQSRFIVGPQELEYLFPVCGEGFVDEPLECPDVVETRRSSAVPFAVLLFPLTLLGAGLRRRTA